eukprot:CAMPEP_0119551002 /NCGR_PEP_ID=MMETSP1352-20130426/4407_1 /TAXON_ID=265584 /ORGANISM="Stauroneis constricta, Strain CCMP1120" /LENGTH=568 /DNA_ID=CAMNT_0007597005 /DNA_START=199 /DNA_END=1905 /DNA_ORIENTATION=-
MKKDATAIARSGDGIDGRSDVRRTKVPQEDHDDDNHNDGSANGSGSDDHSIHHEHGLDHWQHQHSKTKITRSTYIFALCAAINSVNLGYDIGISPNVGPLIEKDLNLTTWEREAFIGCLNFWSMFGSLFAYWITDRYGRRRSFIAAAFTFILGVLLMASAQSYGALMAGRTLVGLGVGFGLAIDPLYIAEISPASHRGELVTWSEIANNVGSLTGFSAGLMFYKLDDDIEWRVMFLMGGILPVVMIVLVLTVMPESPRWLVANNREAEARTILQKIYPAGYDIDPVLEDISDALERENDPSRSIGWRMIFFPTPAVRRMLIVGVGTAMAQQAVGIDAIQNYLNDVLEKAGVESTKQRLEILILLGVIKLLFIFVGGKLFDVRGRRPLLLASLGGMFLAFVIVGSAFVGGIGPSEAKIAIGGLAMYLAFFSIGMGPGAWLIPSEVFPTSVRAKAMSVASFSNRISATFMASTFFSLANAMGWAGFFFVLAVNCLLVAVFVFTLLPETKGRSLEDMALYFAEVTGDQTLLDGKANQKMRKQQMVEMEKGRYQATASDAVEGGVVSNGTMT